MERSKIAAVFLSVCQKESLINDVFPVRRPVSALTKLFDRSMQQFRFRPEA
jgi:hypothetical protein